jgi:dTDP-4-amino-4,6-dideoxygalactose transaminase
LRLPSAKSRARLTALMATDETSPIPVVAHNVGVDELAAAARVLGSESLTTGPEVARFEADLASYFGTDDVYACGSCSAALHLAILAAGVGPGDEVITSAVTFPATVNAILLAGATPVFVDIDPVTLNITDASVASAVTSRTRAVLAVHMGGVPVNLDALTRTCRERRLLLLVDAAHAVASTWSGRHVAQFGDAVCFSFYATKNMTTLEGGALTGSGAIIERARILGRHGMKFNWSTVTPSIAVSFEPVVAGYKYNMTDVQAAIGRVQLSRLETLQAVRVTTATIYDEGLSSCEGLTLPRPVPARDVHSWYLYQVQLPPSAPRDAFRAALRLRGIETGAYYRPLHQYPLYASAAEGIRSAAADAAYERQAYAVVDAVRHELEASC